jgi:hypothetical protein
MHGPNSTPTPPVKIDWVFAAPLSPATVKAIAAYDLVVHQGNSRPNACRKVDASPAYLAILLRITEPERKEVCNGWRSLSSFVTANRRCSDMGIRSFIRRVGADRVLRQLDILTAPIAPAAE